MKMVEEEPDGDIDDPLEIITAGSDEGFDAGYDEGKKLTLESDVESLDKSSEDDEEPRTKYPILDKVPPTNPSFLNVERARIITKERSFQFLTYLLPLPLSSFSPLAVQPSSSVATPHLPSYSFSVPRLLHPSTPPISISIPPTISPPTTPSFENSPPPPLSPLTLPSVPILHNHHLHHILYRHLIPPFIVSISIIFTITIPTIFSHSSNSDHNIPLLEKVVIKPESTKKDSCFQRPVLRTHSNHPRYTIRSVPTFLHP